MRLLLKLADTLVYIYIIALVLGPVLLSPNVMNPDTFVVVLIFGMVYEYGAIVGMFMLYRRLRAAPLTFGLDVLSLGSHFVKTLPVLILWNFLYIFIFFMILGGKLGGHDWVTIGGLGRISLMFFGSIVPGLLILVLQNKFPSLELKKA